MSPNDRAREQAIETALTETLHRLPEYRPSARLTARVGRLLAAPPARRPPAWRRMVAPALAAALVALVTLPVVVYQRVSASRAAGATLVGEAVGNHMRLLQAQRPLEIESADGHRVRPWFEGRLDFSPVVTVNGDADLPLRGGALAWFVDRKAAAFVYGLRLHTVSLFVFRAEGLSWPATGWRRVGARDVFVAERTRGFTVVLWRADELGYALVSDADPREILEVAKRFAGT